MTDPLDAYAVAEVLEAELDALETMVGSPGPKMAAAATVYRLARALAEKTADPNERRVLLAIADEPWEARDQRAGASRP